MSLPAPLSQILGVPSHPALRGLGGPGPDARQAQPRSPSAPYSRAWGETAQGPVPPHHARDPTQRPAPRDRASARSSRLQKRGVGPAGLLHPRSTSIAPPAAARLPLPSSVCPSLPPFLSPAGAGHAALLLGRSSPWPTRATLGQWLFGVECSPPRAHGWGSEVRARSPRGRRLGGGAAVAVPGSPDRAPLQRGYRERAALPGPPQHPVRLFGGAAQPRGEPMARSGGAYGQLACQRFSGQSRCDLQMQDRKESRPELRTAPAG